MILKSAIPFIAILLFLLALLSRNKRILKKKRLRKEPSSFFGAISFPAEKFGKVAGALGWLFIAFYCYLEAFDYFARGEYFDVSLALVFLAFSLLLALLLVKTSEKEDLFLFFSITKIALIAAIFYFPFSEITFLGDSLIFITAKITTIMLNLFNPGSAGMDYPSIYSTSTSFDVEIILACTAIQSMVLFTGLIFGVNAPMRRKLKAFLVSVPVLYGLNIFRNTFVAAAYFGQWFASPRWQWFLQWFIRPPPVQSFDIAHGIIARIVAMIALIAIAYAVFVILPEALNLVEDFFRFISRKRHV